MTDAYETTEQSHQADAVRDAENWARSHRIRLEFLDWVSDDSGKGKWQLTFTSYPEQVGCELTEIGRIMRGPS